MMLNRPVGSLAAAALRSSGSSQTCDSLRPDLRSSARRPSPLSIDAEPCPTPAISVPPTPSPTASSAAAWRNSLAAQCLGPPHLLATQPPTIEVPKAHLHHALPRGRVGAAAAGLVFHEATPAHRQASEMAWPAACDAPSRPPVLPPPVLPPQLSSGVFKEAPPPPAHSATGHLNSMSGVPGAMSITIDPFADQVFRETPHARMHSSTIELNSVGSVPGAMPISMDPFADQVASMLSVYAAATAAPGSVCPPSPPPFASRHLSSVTPASSAIGQQDSLIVKNTFFDVQRSPSLERVCKERQVHSCPGSRLASPRARWHGLKWGSKEQELTPSLPSSTASTVDTMEASSTPEDLDTRLQYGTWNSNPRGMLLDPMPLPQVEPIVEHGEWDVDGFEAASGQSILDLRALVSRNQGLVHNVNLLRGSEPVKKVPQTTQKRVLQLEAALPVSGSNFKQPSTIALSAPPAAPARAPPADLAQTRSAMTAPDLTSAELGSEELPSIGSLGHYLRRCKPCAFANKAGCTNGAQCSFCHLCKTGEKKRRRKEKRALLGAMKSLSLSAKTDVVNPSEAEA